MKSPKQNGTLVAPSDHDPLMHMEETHLQSSGGSRRPVRLTRRSGRAKEEDEAHKTVQRTPDTDEAKCPRSSSKKARKTPKTTTVTASEELSRIADILSPPSVEEIQAFEGWTQMESDPQHLAKYLATLGLKDLSVTEVFQLDELGYGQSKPEALIFLFNYAEGSLGQDNHGDQSPEIHDKIWFANQTTKNNCATVALFNILMNMSVDVLSPEMRRFKEWTDDLSSEFRGHAITRNAYFRAIHNGMANRGDLLQEDFDVGAAHEEAEVEKSSKKRKKKSSSVAESQNHYIAFIRSEGEAWQLDGFEPKPLCLGRIDGGGGGVDDKYTTWLTMIQVRISDILSMLPQDTQAGINLIALGKSRHADIRTEMRETISKLFYIDKAFCATPGWSAPAMVRMLKDDEISAYDLTMERCLAVQPATEWIQQVSGESAQAARERANALEARFAQLTSDFYDTSLQEGRFKKTRHYEAGIHHLVMQVKEMLEEARNDEEEADGEEVGAENSEIIVKRQDTKT
jgi:ubiquitin carboxyl-terminal hydrolase L5